METSQDSHELAAEVTCYCNIPTPLKLCRSGVNKGKYFWGCANYPNRQCQYFRWAEEHHDNNQRKVNFECPSPQSVSQVKDVETKHLRRELKLANQQVVYLKKCIVVLGIFSISLVVINIVICCLKM